MNENEIINGCKSLDRNCQRMLVATYSGMLYTVTRRYCKDEFLSKEALQEGLIRIFKSIKTFDERKGSFTGWMKKIVVNESIKVLKKKGRYSFEELNEYTFHSTEVSVLDHLHEEQPCRS